MRTNDSPSALVLRVLREGGPAWASEVSERTEYVLMPMDALKVLHSLAASGEVARDEEGRWTARERSERCEGCGEVFDGERAVRSYLRRTEEGALVCLRCAEGPGAGRGDPRASRGIWPPDPE